MLLFVVFLSVIITLILGISNYRKNRHALFLGGFLSILSIYNITHYLVTVSYNVFWSAVFYAHFAPLYLLMGPMLYFFVRGLITQRTGYQKNDWVHYIPALLQFLSFSGYIFFTPFSTKMEIMSSMFLDIETFNSQKFSPFIPQSFFYIARMLSLIGYILANIVLIFESKSYILPQYSKAFQADIRSNKKILEWLIIGHSMLVITMVAYQLFLVQFLLNPLYFDSQDGILMSIGATGILLFNISIFFYPEILYGMKLPERIDKISVEPEKVPVTVQNKVDLSSRKEMVDLEKLASIAQKIEAHFAENKPYLDPGFSMQDLEAHLGIPQNELKSCFHNYLKIRFIDYRMKYRVAHAKDLISDRTKRTYSFDAIGTISGFGSKSNFFQAFKRENNMTPKQFVEELRIRENSNEAGKEA